MTSLPLDTHQAPKRSNSGREIVYVFPPPGGSAPNPSVPMDVIPDDVARAFDLLRSYAFRDVYRWLKIDRQDELNRNSVLMGRPNSTLNTPDRFHHTPRLSVASSTHGSSRASSIFSAGAKRISVASTNTTYSHMSDPGQQHRTSSNWEATLPVTSNRQSPLQTAHVVTIDRKNSVTLVNSPVVKSARPSVVSNQVKPQPRQRETDVEAKKKYFCTACNKGFARKYDWKVHEQRYHEQQTQYPCPDCNQILFAETLFKSHHRDAHGCQDCPHAKSIAKDVDVRRKRTAWGCGFCSEMLDDWEKRCDHVAAHYDNGVKREDWDHSKVIIGLLRQPDVDREWRLLLTKLHGQFPTDLGLRFSKEATGRSHGENAPQLQDLLEFGACARDINTMVQLSYEQGYRRPASVASQPQIEGAAVLSPSFHANQDAVMESPIQQSTQESPIQFVAPTNDSSPMDAFDMQMNASLAAYQTPADSRMNSVGPAVSATITNPLDWTTYQIYPDHFTMPQSNPNRMSISYDKPLPSIPSDNDGRTSITPRPPQNRPQQHVADLYATTDHDQSYETWSLVGSTLVDDPNVSHPFFAPDGHHAHHFV